MGMVVNSYAFGVAGATPIDPATLFAASEKGAWYDPSDLSTLWQDTAGTTAVTTDGQSVARIDDKSGNGNHLVQATSGNRPLYKTDGTLRWLLFDGSNDRLAVSTFGSTVNQPLTVSAGWIQDVSGEGALCDGGQSSQRVHIVSGTSFTNTTCVYAGLTPGGALATTGFTRPLTTAVDTAFFSGASSTYRRNGVDGTVSGNPGTNSMNGAVLGTWQGQSSGFLNGKIYGFLVVGRALTTPERTGLEAYMAGKSGISF
jgi:hypothetical protein